MRIKGATVLVVGMAKSGLAAARLLLKKGARVIACDAKPLDAMLLEVAELGVKFRIQSPDAWNGVS